MQVPELMNTSDAPITRSIPSGNHQVLEAVLHASILDEHVGHLYERLRGVCDPVFNSFEEHEMVFALKTGEGPDILVHFRRKLSQEPTLWHCRYVGTPIPDNGNLFAICRQSTDSIVYSKDLMEFVKSIGLRLEYEFVARGKVFTFGPIKILVFKTFTTEKIGTYSKDNLKPLLESHLVEAIIPIENEDGPKYSKQLKDFCDQLAPLVHFRKIDYTQRARVPY
uniref:Mediator of RNA polymerase II transcription subunit 18 n=1 Tax=Panagrolaimus superbus TaxID=310955 RepID=A0A914ZFS3_9BILA